LLLLAALSSIVALCLIVGIVLARLLTSSTATRRLLAFSRIETPELIASRTHQSQRNVSLGASTATAMVQ
jgi:hypothetical protein